VHVLKDLCERHDKGTLADHQKTLHRLNQLRKKNSSAFQSTVMEVSCSKATGQLNLLLLSKQMIHL
jgi:hypothetical protein